MGKGILLELEGRHAVVLTSQGEFRRVSAPAGNPQIGDEIAFSESDRGATPRILWGWMAAAAMLLAVLLPTGYQGWSLQQPAAMITVDINPSVELIVNKRDQVLGALGLNADGELLLMEIDWRRRPVSDVIGSITEQAVAEGWLDPTSESGTILVAVAPVGKKELTEEVSDRITRDARAVVNKGVAEAAAVKLLPAKTTVAVLSVTVEEKETASDVGMTPGKLRILQEIQAVTPEVSSDQVKSQGIGRLIQDLGQSPASIFSKAEEPRSSKGEKREPSEGDAEPVMTDAPGKSDAPGKADPPGKSDAPGKADPPGKSDASDKADPPGKPDAPGKSDAPDKADPPGKSDAPDKADPPGKSDAPGKTDPPGKSDAPGKTDRPGKGHRDTDDPSDAKAKARAVDEARRPDQPNAATKETWKVPLLPIEIPIPAFLRDNADKSAPGTPVEKPSNLQGDTKSPSQGSEGAESGNGATERPTATDSPAKPSTDAQPGRGNGNHGESSTPPDKASPDAPTNNGATGSGKNDQPGKGSSDPPGKGSGDPPGKGKGP